MGTVEEMTVNNENVGTPIVISEDSFFKKHKNEWVLNLNSYQNSIKVHGPGYGSFH